MEEKLYDVAVIGGGPGGSSFATYARKKGLSVILFEKEKFPRDHVGESLIPFTYFKMKELGVLDEIKEFATFKPGVNFVDIDGTRESTWCFGKILKDESHLSFHTLRAPFDHALLKNSAKHGAEIHEEYTVRETILDNPDGNVSLLVENKLGERKKVNARFLVDASGQGSFLAKKLGTKTPYKDLDRTAFFSHWLNTNYDEALNQGLIKIIYLGGLKKGWIWVIPVGRNHLSIGVTLANAYVRETKAQLIANGSSNWQKDLYVQELSYALALKPILENANMEHETLVLGDYSYFTEKKYGTNWAMVGDAGAFLDPIFSSGIYVAMETADKVAQCVHTSLTVGVDAAQKQFKETHEILTGGYDLIEKFVRLFYSPDLLNFAHVDPYTNVSFDKFLYAYNIFHYLLAGDFFLNSKKYAAFIDTIKNEKSYNRFLTYVKQHSAVPAKNQDCGYTFDEIYGHLPMMDQVFKVIIEHEK